MVRVGAIFDYLYIFSRHFFSKIIAHEANFDQGGHFRVNYFDFLQLIKAH
jgi:hypothetical protein